MNKKKAHGAGHKALELNILIPRLAEEPVTFAGTGESIVFCFSLEVERLWTRGSMFYNLKFFPCALCHEPCAISTFFLKGAKNVH